MTPSELVTVVSETAQATAFSREDIARLQLAAEQAIAAIEVRIETGNDKGTVQLNLARAIYELRRELEEIDRWRQHYL